MNTEGTPIPVSTPNSGSPAPAAPATPSAPAAPASPNPAPTPAPEAHSGQGNEPAANVVTPNQPAPDTTSSVEAKTDGVATDATTASKPLETTPAFKVPDEYKDKPWAAKVTSEAEMWKQLANAQELIGKKSIVPDLKAATPEDREAFYAQLRPKDVSEYVFTGDQAMPAAKDIVGKALMENGISATQANPVIEAYTKFGEEQQAKMFDPEEFTATMKSQFGNDWEATTGRAYNNLKAMMPEQDQKLMEHLPNAYAGLVYRMLGNTDKAVQNMMARYGVKETNLAHFADKAGAGASDVGTTRAQIRSEMARLAQGPHTADQMGELRTKLSETYKNDPRIAQG